MSGNSFCNLAIISSTDSFGSSDSSGDAFGIGSRWILSRANRKFNAFVHFLCQRGKTEKEKKYCIRIYKLRTR